MGMSVKVDGVMVGVVALIAVAAYVWWRRDDVFALVDPTSPDNIANTTFNTIMAPIIPGDENLGGWCAENKANPACWGFVVADWVIPE